MSTLNIAIAHDVESSKDSEIITPSVEFDYSEPLSSRYLSQSKQIADMLTSFATSIPREDFKSDILVTKYNTELESLKDGISEILTFVSRDVYDSIVSDFNLNLQSVDKGELAKLILGEYGSDSSESKFSVKESTLDYLNSKVSLRNSSSDKSSELAKFSSRSLDTSSESARFNPQSSDSSSSQLRFSDSKVDSGTSSLNFGSLQNSDSQIQSVSLKGSTLIDTITNDASFSETSSDGSRSLFEVKSDEVSDSSSKTSDFVESSSDTSNSTPELQVSESSDVSNESLTMTDVKSDSSETKVGKLSDSTSSDESDDEFRVVEVLAADSSIEAPKVVQSPPFDSTIPSATLESLASELKQDVSAKPPKELSEPEVAKASIPDSKLPPRQEIEAKWETLLSDTSKKFEAPFKAAEKRFNNRTGNIEAWASEANDIAISVTSEVFNAGVRMVRSADGELVKAITDLPGYMSSIIRSSIVSPTNKFIYDISNSVSNLIRTVVDLPTTLVDAAASALKAAYSSILGSISDGFSNFTQGIESKLINFISDLFTKKPRFTGLNRKFDYRTKDRFTTRYYSQDYSSASADLSGESSIDTSESDDRDVEGEMSRVSKLDSKSDGEAINGAISEVSSYSGEITKPNLKELLYSSELNKTKFVESVTDKSSYSTQSTYFGKSKTSGLALKRSDLKNSSQEFLSDAYWDISIAPHKFGNSDLTPPNILEYYGSVRRRLPIISFDLSGEMIDNSDFELYNSFMTSYPSMYSRMNRLTISLPEIITRKDNRVGSSLRRFKEDYIKYVTDSRLTPSFRNFRYCSYEIVVTKFTQTWHTVKTWKLLGIPEFSNSTRGGSDSSIEIGEISFNIVGEDLTTSEQSMRDNELIRQNNESTYNDLLAEKEYYRNKNKRK